MLTRRLLGVHDQLIFLHLPKTAGTSFRIVLDRHFAPDDICPAYFNDELAHLSPEAIAACHLIRGHFFYDALASLPLGDAVCITFVRDPVERVLSTYANMQDKPDPVHYPWGTGLSLAAFLDHPLARAHVTNLQTRRLAARLRLDSWAQLEAAVDRETEEVLAGRWARAEEAIPILAGMTYFGLAERFDDSMALLACTFAWPPLAAHPRLNVASRRLQRDAVPADLLDRIRELNREDQKLYDYARQLFAGRYALLLPMLLDEHYRRNNPSFANPRSAYTVAFGGPLPHASGWYDPDAPHGEQDGWRWLGPEPEATLDLPLASDRDCRVRLCVAHAIAPDLLESLRLYVNDWPIALARESGDSGRMIYAGTIPALALAAFPGACRFTFRVARTVAPASQNPASGDTRRLGVALSWLRVEPATE